MFVASLVLKLWDLNSMHFSACGQQVSVSKCSAAMFLIAADSACVLTLQASQIFLLLPLSIAN